MTIGKSTYYINGVGVVSPQETFDNAEFLSTVKEYQNNILKCVAPDFKNYINPAQARRLSRLLKLGLSAAIVCMRDAKDESPQGIITATGYGLLEDTAHFLTDMLQRHETQLTPTYFMQSTYNSLGGLVALHLKCTGYNTTYVSKGFAFETALTDAMMQLSSGEYHSFLVGSYDEAGETQLAVNSKAGHYKSEPTSSLNVFESQTVGALQGEGAAFFSLSIRPAAQMWCSLQDVRMIYKPSEEELAASVLDFLAANTVSLPEVDILISGESGDVYIDAPLLRLTASLFARTPRIRFKHLCGEYCTASSFACWLGASVLKKQHVPPLVRADAVSVNTPIKTVLIINQYRATNYSFILLRQGP